MIGTYPLPAFISSSGMYTTSGTLSILERTSSSGSPPQKEGLSSRWQYRGRLSSACTAFTASLKSLRRFGVRHSASATARRSWSASVVSVDGFSTAPLLRAIPCANARNMQRPSPSILYRRRRSGALASASENSATGGRRSSARMPPKAPSVNEAQPTGGRPAAGLSQPKVSVGGVGAIVDAEPAAAQSAVAVLSPLRPDASSPDAT
mmetsp:Transcript_4460/g.11125  ORF Transcript_4460/g.11125 Transcript_4460/m.11125 type:complete len:207 (+) Transcript_4460:222-842(+)